MGKRSRTVRISGDLYNIIENKHREINEKLVVMRRRPITITRVTEILAKNMNNSLITINTAKRKRGGLEFDFDFRF